MRFSQRDSGCSALLHSAASGIDRKGWSQFHCCEGLSFNDFRNSEEIFIRIGSIRERLGMAILFVGGPAAGKFDFQIDDVKLE